jgi:hypothetical protein
MATPQMRHFDLPGAGLALPSCQIPPVWFAAITAARGTLLARQKRNCNMRIAALDHIAKAYTIRGIFP